MPAAHARRRVVELIGQTASFLHGVNLYAAAGISSLGWTLSRFLHFSFVSYVPLWFFGTLFIYNLDRLKNDPADEWNTPDRTRFVRRHRKKIHLLCWLSAGCVLATPLILQNGLLLLLVILAATVSVSYSVPLFGVRLKSISLLKTLFVPFVVTGVVLLPALLQGSLRVALWQFASVAGWTFSLLLFNVFVCDQRDVSGDTAHGIRSLPIWLGPVRSRRFLFALLITVVLLSALLAFSTDFSRPWLGVFLLPAAYLALLFRLVDTAETEAFYEWIVEGLLFIPALGYLIGSIR